MNKSTHKAVIEVSSYEDSPELHMEVRWEPTIEGKDIEDQGYIPAAYQFMQQVIELTEAMSTGMLELEEEDMARERTLN